MAEGRKKRPKQAQEAQQADVAQLMQLPLSEVQQLPEEQRQLVYDEMARLASQNIKQILENTETPIENVAKVLQANFEAVHSAARQIAEMQNEWQRKWDALRQQYGFKRVIETIRQFLDAGPILQPYIDAICAANPEKWEHATIAEVYAAAAAAARADGKEVPPLWFEEQGEQLAMQLETPETQQEAKAEDMTPAQIIEALKTVQAITPTAHIMPSNSLMNTLTQKPAINAGPFDLVVASEQGRRKEITNYTIVNYDPGDSGITITDPKLSEYERQVSDAVISLWAEAKRQNMPPVFTVDMIYQSMPGGGDRPQPAQRTAITRTIEKLRRLHIYMDATEEMRKRGKIGSNATFTMDSFYFQVDRAEYKARNSRQTVTAYKMESAPIMLTYSQMTGQLLTVQAKYLDIRKIKAGLVSPEVIPATAGRQAMTGYMLRRIAIMRHDEEAARDALRQYDKRRKKEPELEAKPLAAFRKQSRVILFDTIFTEAGTATADRKQAGLNRAYCYEVLEYWQATGLIKGYTEQKKGKKITGFSVKL